MAKKKENAAAMAVATVVPWQAAARGSLEEEHTVKEREDAAVVGVYSPPRVCIDRG